MFRACVVLGACPGSILCKIVCTQFENLSLDHLLFPTIDFSVMLMCRKEKQFTKILLIINNAFKFLN